jgi:hypothetical protein
VIIPDFDGITGVLPPHGGDPTTPALISPYKCSLADLVDRFSYTPERKKILFGFLRLRQVLFSLGATGFQWIDGSFCEDKEHHEGKPPGDIDVVTYYRSTVPLELELIVDGKPIDLLRAPKVTKAVFHVDHYLIDLESEPEQLVVNAAYWFGLFSHRRDGLWKGMLQLPMIDPQEDADQLKRLEGVS